MHSVFVSGTANLREPLVKRKPNLFFILQVSVAAALGGLLFGFDTAVISGAIPYIRDYFSLNEFMVGWAVSSILIGCGTGAVLAGPLADRFGRRWALLCCGLLFALSGIGVALSGTLPEFVFFRLLGGLSVGAAAMVSPMYIAEISPSFLRGRLVAMYQLAIVTGILLAYFSNYMFADTGTNNWRWMFASQTAPAILFLIAVVRIPETPRWLIKRGRIDQARVILQKTERGGDPENEIMAITQSFRNEAASRLSEMFSRKYYPVLWIGIFIAVFQQVTGINAIMYYAPEIFRETGLSMMGALLQTMGIGVVNVLATILAIVLIDRVGRKKLLLGGSLLMGISLIIVSVCFWLHYFAHYVVLIFMLLYVASFCCTLGAVTWVYLSEIFPNSIRGLALSFATLILWISDFAVSYTFPVMKEKLGTSATLLTYAFFCMLAFLYVKKKVPETKGKSLELIELSFIQ
jgi:sugar porter (SP) family MFS transporter